MTLDRAACDRARQSRDARFDGRFFIGVTTTRIYCRPVCPARAPKDEHVRYFVSAAAAEAAGFRPCLRCRPEASPGTPAWSGTSGVVSRALRLIGEGALDSGSVEALADRLGVTGRHLRRLFERHLGASPLDLAATRRLHFAKKLIDETALPMREVAAASGFGSIRRFNSVIRRTYSRTPTALRRLAAGPIAEPRGRYEFTLAYRPPLDWDALLGFLRARATPGVEAVDRDGYRRTISLDGRCGWLEVSRSFTHPAALRLAVRFPDPRALLVVVERVRRMFDLSADPATIGAQFAADPLLRPIVHRHPGMRTPGAWEFFELTVRAILGQQVAVAAATTIAGRIAARFGEPIEAVDALSHVFPTAAQLRSAPLEECGVMPARAGTIRRLAATIDDGRIPMSTSDSDAVKAALRSLPGIGGWTAEYVAMRGLNEPDAFPTGDLVLRRMAGGCTPAALERRAESWRPWRAYAVMLLWQEARDRNNNVRSAKASRSGDRLKPRAGDRLKPRAPAIGSGRVSR
jgi:AraC family transcriptional regulator, regulatory protein of adaptative response / DNA-3-methyladenine glycosylase II